LKIHFPKTNSHSGFFVTIVVVLLLFQQDETNVKIFLPVATATDKNTSLHCQLPSPFALLCFALLACLVGFLETQKKTKMLTSLPNKNANFTSLTLALPFLALPCLLCLVHPTHFLPSSSTIFIFFICFGEFFCVVAKVAMIYRKI
jgi:hypothetical protein